MKRTFYLPIWVALLSTAVFSSCSNQNPEAFGNRKFYPEANATINVKTSIEKPGPVTNGHAAVEANIQESLAKEIPAAVSTGMPDALERVEITRKAVKKALELKPVLSFRERLALKLVSRSMMAKAANHTDEGTSKVTPGSAVAGFILGILGIFVAGIILGTLAIIFSGIALAKPSDQYKKGLAIAGLILGIVGVIGAIIYLASM